MMKYILLLLVFLSFGCRLDKKHENINDEIKIESVSSLSLDSTLPNYRSLILFAKQWKPSNIDITQDLNDTLETLPLKEIYLNSPEDSLLLICKSILLKLNLYQLQTTNQGYDLYSMRKGGAKIIIDFYLMKNKIDTMGEFMNSGRIYDLEKTKQQTNLEIKLLIENIKDEVERIKKNTKSNF